MSTNFRAEVATSENGGPLSSIARAALVALSPDYPQFVDDLSRQDVAAIGDIARQNAREAFVAAQDASMMDWYAQRYSDVELAQAIADIPGDYITMFIGRFVHDAHRDEAGRYFHIALSIYALTAIVRQPIERFDNTEARAQALQAAKDRLAQLPDDFAFGNNTSIKRRSIIELAVAVGDDRLPYDVAADDTWRRETLRELAITTGRIREILSDANGFSLQERRDAALVYLPLRATQGSNLAARSPLDSPDHPTDELATPQSYTFTEQEIDDTIARLERVPQGSNYDERWQQASEFVRRLSYTNPERAANLLLSWLPQLIEQEWQSVNPEAYSIAVLANRLVGCVEHGLALLEPSAPELTATTAAAVAVQYGLMQHISSSSLRGDKADIMTRDNYRRLLGALDASSRQ